jgi:effector-binding domain-containing protein
VGWCAAAEPAKRRAEGGPPATQPAAYLVTPMRVAQFKGSDSYCYVEAETTFADLKQTIDQLLPKIEAAMNSGRVQPQGGLIFVYQGATTDPSKSFRLQVGVPTRGAVGEAPDGAMIRKLQPLRAASVIFSGELLDLPQAYQKLYAELFAAGLTPTGETRELYLYWEGPESNNNVVLILAAVK